MKYNFFKKKKGKRKWARKQEKEKGKPIRWPGRNLDKRQRAKRWSMNNTKAGPEYVQVDSVLDRAVQPWAGLAWPCNSAPNPPILLIRPHPSYMPRPHCSSFIIPLVLPLFVLSVRLWQRNPTNFFLFFFFVCCISNPESCEFWGVNLRSIGRTQYPSCKRCLFLVHDSYKNDPLFRVAGLLADQDSSFSNFIKKRKRKEGTEPFSISLLLFFVLFDSLCFGFHLKIGAQPSSGFYFFALAC